MPTTAPMRLLLLEDDAVSARFLVEALARLPSHVDHATTLAEAAARAGDGHALWVFDARLPDGHAADLLPRLRAAGLATPALALTADSDDGTRRRLLAAGFGEVLAKPVGAAALRATVRARLGGAEPAGIAAPARIGSGHAARAEPATSQRAGRATDEALPRWDDAAALAALGDTAAVAALRALFVAELPDQDRRVAAACDAADPAAAREVLHRLKAGCAFVGAASPGSSATPRRVRDSIPASPR
jgi:CheY-like chemotaxis protein